MTNESHLVLAYSTRW